MIAKHYEKLFTSTSPHNFEEDLEGIPLHISQYMNEALTKPFNEK